MTLAPEGLGMTKQELEIFAETQAQTDNQLCLLYLGEDLVGVLNIAADQNRPCAILEIYLYRCSGILE